MNEPVIVDTHMHGHAAITAAYLLRGELTALVETGPKSSAARVLAALESLGVDRLDWIVVTHIHLDHAGAAGTLARRFPGATVAVHPLGARHLIDPSRLWSSARRIYGEAMEALWGGVDPVPEERVRGLEDGEKIDLGGRSLQAVESPGHARHHHAYLDDLTGIVFTGDALGVRLRDVGRIRPATPPPELDVEKAVSSIARIGQLRPAALWFTHFGRANDGPSGKSVEDVCDEAIAALRQWEKWVRWARGRTRDIDEVTALVRRQARAALERDLDDAQLERLDRTTSYRLNVAGYMRYLDRLEAGEEATTPD